MNLKIDHFFDQIDQIDSFFLNKQNSGQKCKYLRNEKSF